MPENITINTSTTIFQDKLNLSFNIGYQRDDLENQKEQATSRTVGSVNATYKASEKLTITSAYSNFSTFTNAKVNQFDAINDDNLLDNISDELDYKQLSQNANVSINYIISKKETKQQNLNINYALADVSNEQGGIVRIGDASTFHNVNTAYTLGFPKKGLNITTALNGTLNTIGKDDSTTWGPVLNVNKKFLDNKLNTGFAAAYNTSDTPSGETSTTNFRLNASYVYKEKHNFNLNAIQLFRVLPTKSNQELTITFGYQYRFDLDASKIKIKRERKVIEFSYKTHVFKGEPQEISNEITAISKTKPFEKVVQNSLISNTLKELALKMRASESKKDRIYKKHAIAYLKYIYINKNFTEPQRVTKKDSEKNVAFSYKEFDFKGSHEEVTKQIKDLTKTKEFYKLLNVKIIKNNLNGLALKIEANEIKKGKTYKKHAIAYLDYLFKKKNFINEYNELTFNGLRQLYKDASKSSISIKNEYLSLLQKLKRLKELEKNISEIDAFNFEMKEKKYKAHKWMLEQLKQLSMNSFNNVDGYLYEFNVLHMNEVYLMIEKRKTSKQIENYLILQLIDFYHQRSFEIKNYNLLD